MSRAACSLTPCGRERALGLMVSQRNMGLMAAATDGILFRNNVALFRAEPIPDLSLAATGQADRDTAEGGDERIRWRQNGQRVSYNGRIGTVAIAPLHFAAHDG